MEQIEESENMQQSQEVHQAHPAQMGNITSMIKKYGLAVKTEGSRAIIKVPNDLTGEDLPPYLKGLIFNKDTDEVICPGVIVPKTSTEIPDNAVSFSPAYDGVLFRVYYTEGAWQASTIGQITATSGWGCPPFNVLFAELQDQIDYTLLDSSYCYSIVMCHKAHVNIVPHLENRIVLVEVVTKSLPFTSVPLQTAPGSRAFPHIAPVYTGDFEDNGIGKNITTAAGDRYRLDTAWFTAAKALKPNLPDIFAHWIHLLVRPGQGGTEAAILGNAETKIGAYLKFFPWHTETFNYMRHRFLQLHYTILLKIVDPRTIIPSRVVKFTRELTEEEKTPCNVMLKLLNCEAKHLYYLMNPWNKE